MALKSTDIIIGGLSFITTAAIICPFAREIARGTESYASICAGILIVALIAWGLHKHPSSH